MRLFHWSMVALVSTAIVTGELGDSLIEYHARIGYAIMSLLIFRFGWGLVGGRYARFMTYIRLPRHLIDFLRGGGAQTLGYSPLGGVALFCLFCLLWAQVLTGLFATDDLMFDGPLRGLVGGATSDRLTAIHKIIGPVLIALLFAHLCATAFYKLVLKDNRVWPMIFGDKEVPPDTPDELAGTSGSPVLAVALLAAGAGIVWYIVTHLGG